MAQSRDISGEAEIGLGGWLGFWAQLVILAALAVLGAVFASDNNEPGDYACGLILAVAAIVLAFIRLKNRFDGGPRDWGSFLLVDDTPNLAAVIVVFVVLALGGLLVAAGYEYGGLHDAGIALFVISALAILLSIKHVFDKLQLHR